MNSGLKKQNNIQNIALSAMFLAFAFVLPFFTGHVPEIGNMLSPMHLPVMLCGFVCGGPWGLLVGFTAPLLRSFIVGAPVLFPRAVAMAFELATYGFISGMLYRVFPKKKIFIYISLIIAMIAGRFVWGAVQLICVGFDADKFGLAAFWAGAFVNSVPGIVIQIILVPLLVMAADKIKKR